MATATNYAGIHRNVTLGQAGSFIGFMTLAASLFLVAFELKQARDIAEMELTTQRLDIYHKVNGIYDIDSRLRKDEILRKLHEEGLEALSTSELSIAWSALEGLVNVGRLGYEAHKMGLKSDKYMEIHLTDYAKMTCHFPTLSEELLPDDDFTTGIKKRAATMDCSQLTSPFFEERLKAR